MLQLRRLREAWSCRIRKKLLPCGGFTLIELLVVIAIIGMLAGALIPALGAAREKGRQTKCMSNLRQYGMAFRLYMDENYGKFPVAYVTDGTNWHSSLVDTNQGGIYLGANNSYRTLTSAFVRISTKLLCPTTVISTLRPPDETQTTIKDPHDQWGYCYNERRNNVCSVLDLGMYTGDYQGSTIDALYRYPTKYITLVDGNGNNWDIWAGAGFEATSGAALPTWSWRVRPVHGNSVNALYLDGHVESMRLITAAEKTTFNRAWYGGVPISGNPYLND